MSDFETVVDAIKADLVANVAGLAADKVKPKDIHLYNPQDPEAFEDDGARHLAVWPEADAEDPEPLTTSSHALNQSYLVAVWESSGTEGTRLQRDEDAAKVFLDLHNDIRARLYVEANQLLGSSDRVWYGGTAFGATAGTVRWFVLRVNVRRFQAFS